MAPARAQDEDPEQKKLREDADTKIEADKLKKPGAAKPGGDEDAAGLQAAADTKGNEDRGLLGRAYAGATDDPNLRLHAALGLVRLGDGRGVKTLIAMLTDPHAEPGTRLEAHGALVKIYPAGEKFGYDGFGEDAANHKAVLAWESWWREQGTRIPGRVK